MRQSVLSAFLLALLLPSCLAVAAGVGAGVILSQEMDNNTYVAHVQQDADVVWATAKATFAHRSSELLETDEDLRIAEGVVDNAKVRVSVEVYDLGHSVLRVSAKKYGVNNGEIAEMVMQDIIRQIES